MYKHHLNNFSRAQTQRNSKNFLYQVSGVYPALIYIYIYIYIYIGAAPRTPTGVPPHLGALPRDGAEW